MSKKHVSASPCVNKNIKNAVLSSCTRNYTVTVWVKVGARQVFLRWKTSPKSITCLAFGISHFGCSIDVLSTAYRREHEASYEKKNGKAGAWLTAGEIYRRTGLYSLRCSSKRLAVVLRVIINAWPESVMCAAIWGLIYDLYIAYTVFYGVN